MEPLHPTSNPLEGMRSHSDRMLRSAPRALVVACAVVLFGIALEFLAEVVFWEWFYFRYHRDYRYTAADRIAQWIYDVGLILMSAWMLGLARNLLRGRSKRTDDGLFTPRALRIWGVLFAVASLAALALGHHALIHFHVLLWLWSAAIACFLLAARRSRPQVAQEELPAPIE